MQGDRRDPAPDALGASVRPRLVDVARAAGVHPATASRALDPAKRHLVNEETADRVRHAAAALGYHADVVAQGLKKGRSRSVGVLVADLGNPFIAPVIRGLAAALETHGTMALVAATEDDHDRLTWLLGQITRRRVDALIVTAARLGDEEVLRAIAEQGTPVVLAVRDLPGSGLPFVGLDEQRAGGIAAAHLADLGHRVLAQLVGPADVDTFLQRAAGFRAALAQRGLVDVSPPQAALFPSITEGRRLMDAALAGPVRPTAVFAHNDLMAVGALEAIKAAGQTCPADISVVGYNDGPLTGHIAPPLTTLQMPGEQIGHAAALAALALVDAGPSVWERPTFRQELVIRESTAAPSGGAGGQPWSWRRPSPQPSSMGPSDPGTP